MNSLARRQTVPALRTTLVLTASFFGLLALAGIVVAPVRGLSAWLVAAHFALEIAVGVAVFVAIHVVSGARWWHPVSGLAARLAGAAIVPALVLALLLAAGTTTLYPWATPGASADHLLHHKLPWLNVAGFLVRGGLILLVWVLFVRGLRARMRAAAEGQASRAPARLASLSAVFIVVFGLTASVAAWDWTMSLEPEWYSTMRGVYLFANAILGALAVLTAAAVGLERVGRLRLGESVRHDLGKLLFAFSFFWAYIWFCEYLLIWYADLPEEVTHYLMRTRGGWSTAFWLNPILSFVVPFVALMGARAKKNPQILVQVSAVILLGRWTDVLLRVRPPLEEAPLFPGFAIAATLAVLAACVVYVLRDRYPLHLSWSAAAEPRHQGPSVFAATGEETLAERREAGAS